MRELTALLRPSKQAPFAQPKELLNAFKPFADWLASKDPKFGEWYLLGDSAETSRRYKAFDPGFDGQDATSAVLRQDMRERPWSVIIWNGHEEDDGGGSLTYSSGLSRSNGTFEVYLSGAVGESRVGGHPAVAEILTRVAQQFQPVHASVYIAHLYKAVFPDKPGVGWMAYLPRIITKKQVPAAGALIPVMQGSDQQGTIVVSVTEEVFNEKNPEHVKAAHAVEIQLVEHDLLPTYQQLMTP